MVRAALGLLFPCALLAVAIGPVAGGPAPLTLSSTVCNPKSTSPSALAIPAANVGHAHAGDWLNASMEFRVANYSRSDRGIELFFPTTDATFPQLNGAAALKVHFVPINLFVTGSAWSSAAARAAALHLASAPAFNASQSPYLTTSKIAVMATAGYGNLTLEVRWHWTLFHASTGLTKSGAWTVPSTGSTGSFLPSIFFPAPWVGITSTSGSSVPSGSLYTIGLNGSVANTWFRIVLEFPNGKNVQSIYENTTAAPTFNATMPMAYPNGTAVTPGSYLLHVHDHCQAIVHILSVTAT